VTWVADLLSIAAKSSILASAQTRCHSPRNVLSLVLCYRIWGHIKGL
jgi:hypothetical protein